MSHKADDEMCNTSDNEHFQDVLKESLQSPHRRMVLRGGIGLFAASTLPMLGCGGDDDAVAGTVGNTLGFSSVAKSLLDDVILPSGYTYTILHATGDRIDSTVPVYSNAGTETDDWTRRIGDHHDGMDIYFIDSNNQYTTTDTGRAILCVNHESSADSHFFHPKGQTSNGVGGKKFDQFGTWDLGTRPELESLKEINHHGVSLVEVNKSGTSWTYKLDSSYNRRINAQTEVAITGPAAHLNDIKTFMQTKYSPTGVKARGTLNNCGHGRTPWGTYLACEENWAVYFGMPTGSNPVDAKTISSRSRYGVISSPTSATAVSASSQGWHTVSATDDRFTRWNVSAVGNSASEDFRNEPNTFGYNVEIDPLTATSTPAKRVAMGRFAHEAAVVGLPKVGSPLAFYQGCDSRNEYIYKFVTAANWDTADIGKGLTAGDKYLNEGKLYVAKFAADGTGSWLELTITDPKIAAYSAYSFANQADVLVNTRHAATAVGATKMDRPEWGAVNPANGEIYFTLTNNSAANRTPKTVDAANPRAYTDADGKKGSGNPNGHIIRFKETGNVSTATSFSWDIFLFGAEEDGGDTNLSQLTAANAFSSPDGLWFSKASGICWIQTDDGAMTDETNCMMLAAIPGTVGDGGRITANNKMTVSGVELLGTQNTFIGTMLGEAKLRRFLVAPKGAEVTGLTESPDGKTLFVNIQHPGENTPAIGTDSVHKYESQWPGNKSYGVAGRPRSATLVITRKDGGVIGI